MEPSECGDETSSPALLPQTSQSILMTNKNNLRISLDSSCSLPTKKSESTTTTDGCVTLISQQLEDTYGTSMLTTKLIGGKLPSLMEDNTVIFILY